MPGSLPSGDRRLSVPPVVRLEGQRCRALGGGSLEGAECNSLSHASLSVSDSHRPGLVLSLVCQGEGFGGGDSGSSPQGSGGACASNSRLLQPHVRCHKGYGGGRRPIIYLSTLNLSVDWTPLRMETSQTVLRSVRRNDWMVSIDLKDAYLQIPIHPASRWFLRFTAGGRTWQFRVLCFGLFTAPQVFTRVMAPVSGFLHQLGVRMLRYLDDWLILASPQEEACWARDQVLSLCQELGIVVNLEKSTLTPSRQIVYLGIRIDSQTFRASATPSRIGKFFSIAEEFLSSKVQSAKFWRVLLGHLASLSRLVPNGQLRMRALQLALGRGWDFRDKEVLVPWDLPSRDDLRWWCTEGRLEEGISLALRSPDQMFWSDASNHGLGGDGSRPVRLRCLVGGRGLSFDQPLRVVGRRERSQVSLCSVGRSSCRSHLRQHDHGGLSEKARRNIVSGPERGSPAFSPLGGTVEHHSDACLFLAGTTWWRMPCLAPTRS